MSTSATKSTRIRKYHGLSSLETADLLAVEEPLEIRLEYGPLDQRVAQSLSVTMRTPGADADLATGFLFTEGMVHHPEAVVSVRTVLENVVIVALHPDLEVDMAKLDRHFYTTSSCGVCGKTSLEAIKTAQNPAFLANSAPPMGSPAIIYTLPTILRRAQDTFDATGGLHAAALFDTTGNLLAVREDVGRHNALDKLIGHYFQQKTVPLCEHILLLSGRASFELLQKAAMAGIRIVCAVGAPSSLAVETAEAFGITLIGFLRDNRFNLYSNLSNIAT